MCNECQKVLARGESDLQRLHLRVDTPHEGLLGSSQDPPKHQAVQPQ